MPAYILEPRAWSVSSMRPITDWGRSKMTYDPMRQADIARRLSNLPRAPRCGAETRAGHTCKQAAVRGRVRCRMHRGASGSGGPRGARNGNFRHGVRTQEAVSLCKAVGAQIQAIKAALKAAG